MPARGRKGKVQARRASGRRSLSLTYSTLAFLFSRVIQTYGDSTSGHHALDRAVAEYEPFLIDLGLGGEARCQSSQPWTV